MSDSFNPAGYSGCCRFEDVLPLLDRRTNAGLPEDPKTVIVFVFPYYVGEYPDRNVARYAIVNDYHVIAVDFLKNLAANMRSVYPGHEFACFVDNSPVPEVRAASLAGLGVIGCHGMLINKKFGSRVFIGEIVTTLKLAVYTGETGECLNCGLCVKACPTGALKTGKPLDRALCRSAITQKKSGLTGRELDEIKKGGFAWGCDICADVCPLNKNAALSPINGFYEDILPVLTRENLDAALLKKPYNWRGRDVLLRNLDIIASMPSI